MEERPEGMLRTPLARRQLGVPRSPSQLGDREYYSECSHIFRIILTLQAQYVIFTAVSGIVLDSIDRQIVTLLQENARTSQADIARAVGLAPSAVLERIRKLEARGVVREYVAVLDPRALDQRLLAFVAVRTTDRPGEARVSDMLKGIPEVLEAHQVAGDDCLLLKIRARDPEHLSRILREQIGSVDGVRSTRTTIVLETLKESARLPLAHASSEEVML